MTTNGRERQGQIQRSIFQVLLDEPEGLAVTDVLARAEEILPATAVEDEDYPNQPGIRRYPKKQRFATISSVKAGWLIKDHGVWRLTDEGREAYEQFAGPGVFEKEARQRYQAWLAQAQQTTPSAFDPGEEAEDAAAAQLEQSDQDTRAWLVRGANVSGVNVVTRWLTEGFCSIQWVEIGDIPAGTPRSTITEMVAEAFPDESVESRRNWVGSLHRFINEIAVGDTVVTVDGGKVFVGEVTSEPTYTAEKLVTRQRAVTWANAAQPLSRKALSSPAADALRSRLTVTDLTRYLGEFAEKGGVEDVVDLRLPDVSLRSPTQEMADELLLPRDWLEETVELLNEKRQIILYGPPGTGKTFLALELCKGLVESVGGEYEVVQFHPSYAYEDFFEGLRPRIGQDGSGSITFDLVSGPLRRMAKQAADDPASPYVLIIDEINRANLAKVFGELYFLLEYRDSSVSLQYSEGGFSLPRNLFIVGTMNTADRSIALVDAAMRRRFYFRKLFPTEHPVEGLLSRWLVRNRMSEEPAGLLQELNARIGDPDFAIGPSYLMSKRIAVDGGLERVWRTAILPLLEEHFFGEGRDIDSEFGLTALRKQLSSGAAVAPPAEGTSPTAADDA